MVSRIAFVALGLTFVDLTPAVADPPEHPEWPKLLHTLDGWVSGLAFSPDGKTVAALVLDPDQLPPQQFAPFDTIIAIWDVATGKQVSTLKGHKIAWSVAFSPDGKRLVSAYTGLRLWDVATGKVVATTGEQPNRLMAVAFSPDGKLVASGTTFSGVGKAVALWDADTLKAVPASPTDIRTANVVVFSPDGKTLAFDSTSYDGVHLWDVAAGRERAAIRTGGVNLTIESLAFSPDGKTLAVGRKIPTLRRETPRQSLQDEREVTLWDVATGKLAGRLEGHGRGVYSVAFSPDGRMVASVSRDGTARLWDFASGKLLATLAIEKDAWPSLVAFSPDGKVLAAASTAEPGPGEGGKQKRTIKLWSLERGK